jgi:hypothetical protein
LLVLGVFGAFFVILLTLGWITGLVVLAWGRGTGVTGLTSGNAG